ncbi:MAG: hypothetical protein V4538_02480 [Bacteroidota bacterium]
MSIECFECGYVGEPKQLEAAESVFGFSEVCPKCNGINYNVSFDDEKPIVNRNPNKINQIIYKQS